MRGILRQPESEHIGVGYPSEPALAPDSKGRVPISLSAGSQFTPMSAVSFAWSGGHGVEHGGEMEPGMDRDLSWGLAEANSGELASE